MRQVQRANALLLTTLRPYTHVFSSAMCPMVTDHLYDLAARDAPVWADHVLSGRGEGNEEMQRNEERRCCSPRAKLCVRPVLFRVLGT